VATSDSTWRTTPQATNDSDSPHESKVDSVPVRWEKSWSRAPPELDEASEAFHVSGIDRTWRDQRDRRPVMRHDGRSQLQRPHRGDSRWTWPHGSVK